MGAAISTQAQTKMSGTNVTAALMRAKLLFNTGSPPDALCVKGEERAVRSGNRRALQELFRRCAGFGNVLDLGGVEHLLAVMGRLSSREFNLVIRGMLL